MKNIIFAIFILQIVSCNNNLEKESNSELELKAFEQYERGYFNKSIHYYDQLIERDSLNGYYFFGRGSSYMKLFDATNAKINFMDALRLNYRIGSCNYNLGLLNCFTNDSLALEYFKESLRIEPERDDVRKEYNECLERLKTSINF